MTRVVKITKKNKKVSGSAKKFHNKLIVGSREMCTARMSWERKEASEQSSYFCSPNFFDVDEELKCTELESFVKALVTKALGDFHIDCKRKNKVGES